MDPPVRHSSPHVNKSTIEERVKTVLFIIYYLELKHQNQYLIKYLISAWLYICYSILINIEICVNSL